MNRSAVLLAVAGLVMLAASGVLYFNFRPAAVMPSATATNEAPVAAPAPAPAPVTSTELPPPTEVAPAAPPATDRPVAKRAPVAKTPATAAPAPEAPPATATLRITSDVSGAQVFLDRQFVGQTPFTATDVAPGSHQLNVSAQGYDTHVETVDVAPGSREISVTFRQVRLNASIEVVHKHRMGSCRGRLVATPQGLRYETTDKEDTFGASLLDLETFQVDYLNKNLRVQPRRGKRYDFTDPDGNADRLFVFHRDVERVRERLKKGDVPGN